jgi:type II secretory pathway pseudopilin PulG
MASGARKIQSGIQVVLAIAIIGLCYVLYVSIVEPYAKVERAKEVTQMTRARMDLVRNAMITYERQNGRYVTTLDSLVVWLKTDSFVSTRIDSIFGGPIMLDSLAYSPRTGNMFELQVNDTSDVNIYLLRDPDSRDSIGSLLGDLTLLNAASWE